MSIKKNRKNTIPSYVLKWRISALKIFFLAIFTLLIIRVTYLQIINPAFLIEKGDLRSLRLQKMIGMRGTITDRNNYPMAFSALSYNIFIDPKVVLNNIDISKDKYWLALSKALNMSIEDLQIKILNKSESRFMYLKKKITPELADYINNLKLPGVKLEENIRRFYPLREISAHLIGYVNADGHGVEGVEKSFDEYLKGKPGRRWVRKDLQGRVIEELKKEEKKDAPNLKISIDRNIQSTAYQHLLDAVNYHKATAGIAIMLDIKTFEVLAMACVPSFNPNNIEASTINTHRNRAYTDTFEPASTIKPMVVAASLLIGNINENSIVDTRPFKIGDHVISDISNKDEMTIEEILQYSSNVGAVKLALDTPILQLLNTYEKFGFGVPTYLGLNGESDGYLPYKTKFSDIEKATLAYGYGLRVTPLQIVRAYAILGAKGITKPLSITVVNKESDLPRRRVIPQDIANKILIMLEKVTKGTGKKSTVVGYRVGVKTGTAKKLGKKGKYISEYVSYTVGIAPISDPRLALLILIDTPNNGKYYGGEVAGPVFSQIMGSALSYLNIAPDSVS